MEFDAHGPVGMQTDGALLLSLAGCMAIDMVMILQKMRVQLASFKMDLVGERNPVPPQYYKAIEMVLSIAGKNLDSRKVEPRRRPVSCQVFVVYNTLRKDLEVKVRYVLEEKDPMILKGVILMS